LGIDPVEMRMRNLLKEGSLLSVGTPLPKGVTMDKVLAKCAEKPDGNKLPPVGSSSQNQGPAKIRRIFYVG